MPEIVFTLLVLIAGVINSETVNDDPMGYYYGICTIDNRLEAGWSPNAVLNHYYAPFTEPTQEQIDIADNILNGNWDCPDDIYFLYSLQDVEYLYSYYEYEYKICDSPTKCNVYMSVEQYRNAHR